MEKYRKTFQLLNQLGTKKDAKAREELLELWPNGRIGPGGGCGDLPVGTRMDGDYLVVDKDWHPAGTSSFAPMVYPKPEAELAVKVPYSPDTPVDSQRLVRIHNRPRPRTKRVDEPKPTKHLRVWLVLLGLIVFILVSMGLVKGCDTLNQVYDVYKEDVAPTVKESVDHF